MWEYDFGRKVEGVSRSKHTEAQIIEILLRLNHCQRVAEPFVLNDGRAADTLILAEETVGKQKSFPSDLWWPVRNVVEFDSWPPRFSEISLRSRMICLRS
jgi:hypothetical protein